jgi:hypothetical protein
MGVRWGIVGVVVVVVVVVAGKRIVGIVRSKSRSCTTVRQKRNSLASTARYRDVARTAVVRGHCNPSQMDIGRLDLSLSSTTPRARKVEMHRRSPA